MNYVNEIQVSLQPLPTPNQAPKISCSRDIADFLYNVVYDRNTIALRESFYLIALDRKNQILGFHLISTGSMTGTVVDAQMIFRILLTLPASSFILSHNHPSGNTNPSEGDINITNKIRKAAECMDFKLLDHVILTPYEETYYSFSDAGKL